MILKILTIIMIMKVMMREVMIIMILSIRIIVKNAIIIRKK